MVDGGGLGLQLLDPAEEGEQLALESGFGGAGFAWQLEASGASRCSGTASCVARHWTIATAPRRISSHMVALSGD